MLTEYEVLARVTGGRCIIEVVNTGTGQQVMTPGRGMAPPTPSTAAA